VKNTVYRFFWHTHKSFSKNKGMKGGSPTFIPPKYSTTNSNQSTLKSFLLSRLLHRVDALRLSHVLLLLEELESARFSDRVPGIIALVDVGGFAHRIEFD